MSTIGKMLGITTGGFWPDPAATYPDDSIPSVPASPAVDAQGNLATRGPVTTDEGGFRESFNAALASPWVSAPGAGTIAIANSVLTITGSLTANDRSYVSHPADFMPMVLNLALGVGGAGTPITRGGTNVEVFFGLYHLDVVANPGLDPQHATAQQAFMEWLFPTGAATTSTMRIRSGNVTNGTEILAGATITTTGTAGWRSIVVDGESAIFRDGSTTLPTATVRATLSREIPGLYEEFFFSVGVRNIGAPVAPAGIINIDAAYLKNLDRLVVNTAF